MSFFDTSFKKKYTDSLERLPLGRFEKDLIIYRYVDIVVSTENSYRWTCLLYVVLSNIITIAGVLIAAFVSFDKIFGNCNNVVTGFFWVVWGLSIALTLANKWLYSFNVHKKYVLNKAVLEKFYSEGWSFLAGIGRYGKLESLDNRFALFYARIEKIKLKSIESAPGMETSEIASEILAAGSNEKSLLAHSQSAQVLLTKRSRDAKTIVQPVIRNDPTADDNDNIAEDALIADGDLVLDVGPAEEIH